MSVGKTLPLRKVISPSGVVLLQPYLDVRYINPHTKTHISAVALIDTGADICLIPAFYAETIGHDVKAGKEVIMAGADDRDFITYEHTMKIAISGFVTEEIKIQVGLDIKEPLLGVSTFLHNFILTIDYPEETFFLRTPETPEDLNNWYLP